MRHVLVCAVGGFAAANENNRVYFCRDTFEHGDLDDFELRCDHLGMLDLFALIYFITDAFCGIRYGTFLSVHTYDPKVVF